MAAEDSKGELDSASAHVAVEAHYNSRRPKNVRDDIELQHFRRGQNWIKECFFRLYANTPETVVDVGAGSGGDLLKWANSGAKRIVAVECAAARLEELTNRAAGLSRSILRGTRVETIHTSVGDSCATGALSPLASSANVVSAMFMAHYMFGTLSTAQTFFKQCAGLLAPSGRLLIIMSDGYVVARRLRNALDATPPTCAVQNRVYKLEFDNSTVDKLPIAGSKPFGIGYKFWLAQERGDGAFVDGATEYVAPHDLVRAVAHSCGLRCAYHANVEDFVRDQCMPSAACVTRALEMNVFRSDGSIDPEDWETMTLYRVYVFEPDPSTATRAQ